MENSSLSESIRILSDNPEEDDKKIAFEFAAYKKHLLISLSLVTTRLPLL